MGGHYPAAAWMAVMAFYEVSQALQAGVLYGTYGRLIAEYRAFANASWAGTAERLGLMNRRLTGLRDDLNGGG